MDSLFNYIKTLANLDLLSVGVAIASIGILGFIIFFNNSRSITNKTFLVFSLVTSAWGVLNYLSYRIASPQIAFWVLRGVIFFAVWQAFSLLQLIYVFPKDHVKIPKIYLFGLVPLVVFTSILTLTPLVFARITEISSVGRILKIENGLGIILFGTVSVGLVIGAIFFLLRKLIKSRETERIQLIYILTGALLMFSLIIVFNFILPAFFDNPRFTSLGALFILPFVVATSYAIFKHRFLNIKVFTAEILTSLLVIITFFEIVLSTNPLEMIFRGIIFIGIFVFGIFLIRSVLKEVEQRIEVQNLNEKLRSLNEKLQIAYDEVERLSRAKSEFISIASHQLRTPLTAIKGYISMILEGSYGKLTDRTKTPLENVYKSNERLINLVNDLLSISRIESGKMEFEPEESSIEEIIEGVVGDLGITAEKKKLYLKFEKPKESLPKILLDKDKMRQAILNLVDNAIKYTQKGGIIIKTQITNSKLLITIVDTGEGMEKEELAKIFESFSRGTVGIKAYIEGAGLGLYIARRFVEMHGGKIWAESEGRDKGSTFYIELSIK